MVQHARLIFYSLLLLVIPCESTLAQKIPVTPIDSLITVGYATGSLKTLSGSVEKITETQMNKDQITNPLEAIRGRVPGLTIQRGSNGPAALDAVRLRGTTSLTSGNDPLIIVDGVFGDLSMLTSIYPTDIESFTILKDASETAQYGSRGASGVIEVTTKKGMSGRTQVAYNGSFGISTVYKNLKMLSGDEYRRIASERGISILDKGYNTDFQKEIEQTGLQQNHHIAFYGGSSESSYRVSLGFMDRQGVILNEDMKNFTSNMNMNQKMFDGFLNCELGMFGSIQKNHNLVDYQKTFYSAATFNPTYPNHKDPVTNSWDGITTASQITNPLAWMEVQDDDATSHISTHARLTFNLLEGLKLNLFGAYTYNIVENSQYLPTSVWANGQAYKGTKKRESLLGNMMLTYKKNWKKHFFDVLALAELQKETYTGYYTTVSNFSTDKFGYNNLQAGALRLWEGTNSYYDQPRLASFMGRFNYTYADRYVLTLNARTDASSKFGANHKWGFFPSASAAWVISEEEFMKQLPMVDNLKFRIGYGLAGNQSGIDSYTTLNLVKPNGVVPVGNSAVVSLGDLRNTNPDLKWEKSHDYNIAVDAGLWKNRFAVTYEYYWRFKTDMLTYAPTYLYPPSAGTGGNVPYINFGKVKAWGWDLTLTHKNSIGQFKYDVGVTVSKTFDVVLDYGEHQRRKGRSSQLWLLYQSDGLFQSWEEIANYPVDQDGMGNTTLAPGDIKYKDVDGDNVITANDRVYVKSSAYPDFSMSLSSYKGFFMNAMLQGVAGYQQQITELYTLESSSLQRFQRYHLTDTWTEDNPDATYPRIKFASKNDNNRKESDFWIRNCNYIRLRSLTIGYALPAKLLQKKKINSVSIALQGSNLFTISSLEDGIDPESLRGYPIQRSYGITLNFGF